MERRVLLAAFGAFAGSSAAFGRPEPQLELQQTAFAYTDVKETESSDEDPVESTSQDFQTMPSDLEIQALVNNSWLVTIYPTQPGLALGVGYEITKVFEVGLDLGYNHSKQESEDAKSDTTSVEFGPHTAYSFENATDALELEFRLGYSKLTGRTEETDATTEVVTESEQKESGYEVEFAVFYEHLMNDNFAVATGVGYTYGQGTNDVEDLDTTSGELEVTLLQFRYGFY